MPGVRASLALGLSLLVVISFGCLGSSPSASANGWTQPRLNRAIAEWEGGGYTHESASALMQCMAGHMNYATWQKAANVLSESQPEPPGYDHAVAVCHRQVKLAWSFNRNCADLFEQWGRDHPPKQTEPLVIHRIGTRAWVCEAFLFPPGEKPIYFYWPHQSLHWDVGGVQRPQVPPGTNAMLQKNGTVTPAP
jgi:hypothetical protein